MQPKKKKQKMDRTTTKNTSMSQESFFIAIRILINKPHVVNKRVWGSTVIHNFSALSLNAEAKIKQFCDLEYRNSVDKIGLQDLFLQITSTINKCNSENIEIFVVELFPKIYPGNHAYQLVCFQRNCPLVWFCDITCKELKQHLCPEFPYSLQLQNRQLILTSQCDGTSKAYTWLSETLMPQFIKWGEQLNSREIDSNHLCCDSLTLVRMERYYRKYNELKIKYGKEMVKVWPECTDPSKFVYEDVAIATYLLLLWEDEQSKLKLEKLQTFVDLGCGNGLLVYILTQEGHSGIGIDVRKRNIWDTYPKNICLQENTIVPSNTNIFPTTDWIIGNHSDELTPWIPVVAARSSYECKFFLLPCCAYNFNGTKYQRKNSAKSQYMEYLEYIKELSNDCGFITEIDRLKIPSTKRICLVGRERSYKIKDTEEYNTRIQLIIDSDSTCNSKTDLWVSDFKPRNPTEVVKNCTQIDKEIINSIVKIITSNLLEDYNVKETWSLGKTLEINELVRLIPKNMIGKLKSEAGGLQTLLRNNHQIFKVQKGKVQLRHPKTVDEIQNKIGKQNVGLLRKKPCWFFNNHPQGCPLNNEKCSFLHVKG